jgi:hypothetical protein
VTTSRGLYLRIREASVGVLDLISIQLGRRLGLYAAMAAGEPTAAELADRTGLNARMVREWLEQQAVTGFVELVSTDGEPDQWRYRLPDATREAFTDPDSLSFAAPMADDVLRVPGGSAISRKRFVPAPACISRTTGSRAGRTVRARCS